MTHITSFGFSIASREVFEKKKAMPTPMTTKGGTHADRAGEVNRVHMKRAVRDGLTLAQAAGLPDR
jgi:hypothetical protein